MWGFYLCHIVWVYLVLVFFPSYKDRFLTRWAEQVYKGIVSLGKWID